MKAPTKIQTVWQVIKETVQEYVVDRAHLLGAGIAYYALFSIAPLLVIVLGIASFVFGKEAARGTLIFYVEQYTGHPAAEPIQDLVANAYDPGTGIFAAIAGVVLLVVGAHIVFVQLQHSLNLVWDVPREPRSFRDVVRDRALSLLMTLIVGGLFLGTLLLTAVATWLNRFAPERLPGWTTTVSVLEVGVSIGLVAVLVAAVYKVLPDVEIGWREVWVGAFMTSLLLYPGKLLISLYVSHASFTSTYGAAGSIVVVIVWIYYSAQIFLLGAEFTLVFGRHFGRDIDVPAATAEDG